MKAKGLEYIFTFGKHEGQQLEDVIEDDPDYIGWLARDEFDFDDEVLELIGKRGIA